MSGTERLPELESLRVQLAGVARELAERDRTLLERTAQRDRELQDLREETALLRSIIEGVAAETGDAFFASLAKHLTATFRMQYAIVGAVRAETPAKIRTLAVASGSIMLDNFEYELAYAPCGTGLTETFWCYTEKIQGQFPNFPLLAALKVESYAGLSIRDSNGVVVGLIVVMDTKPIVNQERLRAFLTVLAPRVAAELHRHQAEAARHEAERRLRLTQFAVDRAADGVLWADTSTRFVYANHEACRSLGYTQEELLTLRIADIAPRHDPEQFQCRMGALKQGGAATYKSVHRRKDGTEFPIEVSVTYLEHEGTVYSCAMFRDITDRTRHEQERGQALANLQNIMEAVPDILFTLDTGGNLTSWNSRLAAVTGYGPEELLNKPAATFVPPDEQARTAGAIQQALREGRAELSGHLLTKDGRTIPYDWTGAALRDQAGAIVGITGIGRDVSAQQQAEQELTRQRRHLLESQALAHLGSWEWDIESGDVDWSDELYRVFGHAPHAIVVTYDAFLAALLPDDHDRVLAAVNAALLGHAPYDIDCRIVRPTGEVRTVHCRGDVTRNDSGHPVKMAGTLLDVTERTAIDEALRASEERWQLAIRGSHDGIWDWQIPSGEVFYSSRWKTMRGFADHEVPNCLDEWRSHIHPDDLDRVLQSVDRYLAKQAAAFCEEYRVQRKDGSYMWILDRGAALWASDGTPVRMAGSETDITDRKRAETVLRHRLEFERLIASLSTHFINLTAKDIDSGITHALQALAEFSDVDRSYIFIFRDQGKTVDNTHEWCADGVAPQIDRLQAIPVEAFPWIIARHQRGDIVHLPRMTDLPPEARAEREEFARQAIQSLLTLPILGAHGVIGFLGFDMVREERRWEPEDIALLKLVGEMFANAIERQQAEAALRKSVERFDLGVQGSRDGLWYAERVSDDLFAPHNPIYYSPRMKEIMGVEGTAMPDVLGTWFALVHPDDLPTVLAALTRHLEHRLPYDVEYRILQHGTGALRWIGAKGQAVWDAAGQPIRMAGSFSDITERKRVEEAHRTSQEKLQQALRASHIGLWDWNTDTNETSFSREWKNQLGYEEAELADRFESWDALLHPEDHDQVIAYVQAYLANPEGDYQQEFRLRHKDGTYCWIEARAEFVTEPDGRRVRLLGSHTDITERKAMEAELKLSESRLLAAQRVAHIGSWELDAITNQLWWSDEVFRIFEIGPIQFGASYQAFLEIVHPEDRQFVDRSYTESLIRRIPYSIEHRLLLPDGRVKHVHERCETFYDIAGRPLRSLGTVQDITERKRAEHKLSLTQYTVDHAIDAFYWVDPQARILDVNEAASLMLGYSKDELLAMSVHDLNPDFQPGSWPGFWAESKQRRSMQFETAHRTKQGQFIPVEIQVNYLTFEGKEFHCAYVRDITERKRAETALRESEARTRSILETALDAVVSIDDRGLIIGWNPEAETLFGYSADSALGRLLDETIIPVRYRHTHGMSRVVRGEEGAATKHRFEFFALHRSGREFPVEFAIATAQVEGQPMFTAFIRDITERKQAEAALRESEERYRTVIDLSPSGIIIFCEGRPVYANSMAVAILEAEGLDSILECSSLDFIHPDYHEKAAHTIRKVLAGETPVHRAERVYVKMDGTPIHVHVETVRLMWKGKPAVQEFFSDITERKQMEEALQRSERQLRTVLDTLPIGVWFTDEKGHVLYGNPAGQRLWTDATRVGLPQPEGDALWWETLGKTDSPHRWTIGAVLARGRDQMNEMLEIETTAGERRTIRNSAVPVKNDAGEILGAIVLNEDITARIRAEQALRQEHGLLMAVMDAATDIIFVKDLAGRYIHMNRAGAHTLGMAVDEVVGWNDYAIWPSNLADSCQLADRLVLDTGEPITVEETSESNSKTTTYLTTKAPYRDPEGRIVGVIGVARDITERKRAEEALRASEQLFAKAFQASPNPIVITEVATGRCIDTNQACLDLLGFSREEIVGQTTLILSIWPNPKDRDRLITRLQTPGPIRNEEMTFSTKSGDLRHVLVSSDLVEMNGTQCLITVGSDITERIRAEEDLRRSHAFIRQIIDTDPNFIFAKDRDGRFTLVNKAIADAYGTTVDNLLGKTDADFNRNTEEVAFFLHKDREVMDHLCEQFIPEERITDATGAVRWLQTVKRPILDETSQTTMVLGACTDITERKRIEEALRQRERDLRAALDERERISQDLHDGILQSLYAVGLGLEACAPLMTQQHYPKAVATMGKAIGQLNHVMSEVRNFIAGLESQVLQGSTFPSALREMVRMLAAPHSLRYTVAVDEGAADGISTEQALHLLNIVREAISNSLRHAQATTASVKLKSLTRSIRLSIVDNGIGFEPASMRGVGHGLANMATRARKVGGRFAIKSVPQQGTRITIDLPKEPRHAESERECDSTAARRRS
ncbi:MAG: PAS domain S-box protein [Nitrospira sp.]|nr:PAS domain S-box protein [Nitrospira sp.]